MRPTGSPIIDHTIGGFPPELPIVVSGPSGSGRTVLALELAHHALRRDEPVAFLSAEPTPSLLQHAHSLGFALDAALDSERLAILELHAGAPTLLREIGVGALLDALRRELGERSLVIVDPLSALLAEIVDESRLREIVRELVRSLSDHDLILTLDEERQTQRSLELVLSELCGAFIRLEREPSGRRVATLEKTRTGVAKGEHLEFAIGPGGVQIVGDAMPLPDASGAVATVRRPDAPSAAIEGRLPRVLVVDDDRLLRAMLIEWLGARYEVVAVADGFEALAALVSSKPDLVVLDLLMPRVTGYELLFSMRRAGFDIPVLVASSRLTTRGERLGPLVLGATDFIPKPLSRVELMHKVETLLSLPHTRGSRFGEAEAQALFGSFSGSRMLELPDFAERVARACDFGEKYEISSSIVALGAEDEQDLDRWIAVANHQLRFEDAIVRTDKRLALALLVATAPHYAPRVVDRLAGLAEDGAPLPPITSEVWLASREHARPEVLAELADEQLRGESRA